MLPLPEMLSVVLARERTASHHNRSRRVSRLLSAPVMGTEWIALGAFLLMVQGLTLIAIGTSWVEGYVPLLVH